MPFEPDNVMWHALTYHHTCAAAVTTMHRERGYCVSVPRMIRTRALATLSLLAVFGLTMGCGTARTQVSDMGFAALVTDVGGEHTRDELLAFDAPLASTRLQVPSDWSDVGASPSPLLRPKAWTEAE